MNIGDIFLRLLADDKGFATDVKRKAQTAGDEAGRTLGQRLGAGLKTATASAIGAGAGALFGIAARGASELEEAMGRFRAETGATQEELDSARASVIELSRSNLQGFAEISDTQAKLRTDMGLSQEQAEANTDAFLKYATATGRDATEGVSALDDVLDAWNLDSSKSGEIMDKLIASHQKYGGSITDNERSLKDLAPQLSALNLDIDDGISLLNLFAEGGLDASKAQFALNSAIQKLPPGTSLEEFVAHLASIEDPGERARQAIEVFGARGGAGLANVLRPGMQGLDDFAVGMDEAAGATTEAADAIESTPFNWLKLQLKNLAGPLVEFGGNLAPIILAFSQLGGGKLVAGFATALGGLAGALTTKLPGLLKGIGPRIAGLIFPANVFAGPLEAGLETALTDVPKSGRIKGAASRVGNFLGSGLGKAFALGFAAVAVAGVVETYNRIKGEIEAQGTALVEQVGEFAKSATLEQLRAARNAAQQQLEGLSWDPIADALGLSARKPLEDTIRALDREIEAIAGGIPGGIGTALALGEGAVTGGAGQMVSGIAGAVEGAGDDARIEAEKTPGEISDGLRSGYDQIETALDDLRELFHNALSPTKRIARLEAIAATKLIAKGLNDGRPEVRAGAQQLALDTIAQLAVLKPDSEAIGKLTTQLLASGMTSEQIKAFLAAGGVAESVIGQLDGLKPEAHDAGETGTKSFADGISDKERAARDAARDVAAAVRERLLLPNAEKWGRTAGGSWAKGLSLGLATATQTARDHAAAIGRILRQESPAKEGPFSKGGGMEGWARTAGDDWSNMLATRLRAGVSRVRQSIGLLAGSFGIPSAMTQLAAPSISFSGARAGAAIQETAPGGDTYITNLNMQERLPPAVSVREIASNLRMLEDQGYIGSKRRRK